MRSEIFAAWGCLPELGKDCMDTVCDKITNLISNYMLLPF